MTLQTILITGGAGYVGSVLVPKLLAAGHHVRVIDLYLYGDTLPAHPNLKQIKGDIRDSDLLNKALTGVDAVIHLACISNDPSFELDPTLGRSINFDAFTPLVQLSAKNGVRRFIYASTSSVYGVKEVENVTEDLELEPLTDYSKYKALCEPILLEAASSKFIPVILRPATVCGYSPRLRLDLSVNILTNHAVNNKRIRVFGGSQKRPNLNIEDMTDLYVEMLKYPDEKVNKKIFNAGFENHKMMAIANIVRDTVGGEIEIAVEPTNDNRSYHISSEKIKRELGWSPRHTISGAVQSLVNAFKAGKIPDPMNDPHYYNIKMMQQVKLQ